MSTLERESVTVLESESVWLEPTLLGELLTGALVGADKSKSAIDGCASVYLSYGGGELKVASTDRYKLVIGRVHLGIDGSMKEIQIRVPDVKRILTLIKENKREPHVALNRTGDVLEVWVGGNKVMADLGGQTFPDASHIFKDSAPITGLSLSAELLGSFAKVPSSSDKSQIDLDFTTTTLSGESVPSAILIKVPHDVIAWECALMPMRVR